MLRASHDSGGDGDVDSSIDRSRSRSGRGRFAVRPRRDLDMSAFRDSRKRGRDMLTPMPTPTRSLTRLNTSPLTPVRRVVEPPQNSPTTPWRPAGGAVAGGRDCSACGSILERWEGFSCAACNIAGLCLRCALPHRHGRGAADESPPRAAASPEVAEEEQSAFEALAPDDVPTLANKLARMFGRGSSSEDG
mmetsp:Transcript_13891/g.41469  ORF Transcript_13891/g.41469 Transcript_13891/m.41469 type:complete len:191 (-) Transcript_13891:34-606(-)